MNETPPPYSPRTLAAQALGRIEPHTKAVVPPLHLSTTYLRDPDNAYRSGFAYGRPDNETVRHAESVIAALEGAKAALLFGAGMAAATAAIMALPPGRIIASQVMYWALRDWLVREAPRFGHSVELVDTSDLDAVRAAVSRERPALVWVETPGNPLWTISDIAAIAAIAHAAGARLAEHPAVAHVLYPGLVGHPGHGVAAAQMTGFGAMASIRVSGGENAAIATAATVHLWKRATSLGGVESLIEHRASIEGPASPCPPDLLRLSVGLEHPDDLYADLDSALRAAQNR